MSWQAKNLFSPGPADMTNQLNQLIHWKSANGSIWFSQGAKFKRGCRLCYVEMELGHVKFTQNNKSNFSCKSCSEIWNSCLSIWLASVQSVEVFRVLEKIFSYASSSTLYSCERVSEWVTVLDKLVYSCCLLGSFILDLVSHLFNHISSIICIYVLS